MLKKLLIITMVLFVSACGGGGGGSVNNGSANTMVNGTAATGAAFVGVVNIYGSNGGTITDIPIDSSGNYSADVTGLSAPYFISAVASSANAAKLFSWAGSPGVANVTPFTTLAMFYANGGQDPALLINSWPANSANVSANLPNSKAIVNANFKGVFSAINPLLNTDFSTYDIFSSQLVIGDTFDQILDMSKITTTGSSPVITVNGSTFTFDPNIIVQGGSLTNLGSVTITGADTTIIGATYTPGQILQDFKSVTWRSSVAEINSGIIKGITIILMSGQIDSLQFNFQDFSNSSALQNYNYIISCSPVVAADCSKINFDTVNKKLVLNNVQLGVDTRPGLDGKATAPVTLNGTLFY